MTELPPSEADVGATAWIDLPHKTVEEQCRNSTMRIPDWAISTAVCVSGYFD